MSDSLTALRVKNPPDDSAGGSGGHGRWFLGTKTWRYKSQQQGTSSDAIHIGAFGGGLRLSDCHG